MKFGTKAETLDLLRTNISNAKILPQVCFTVEQWQRKPVEIIQRVKKLRNKSNVFIVRSSALCEDSEASSLAGHFASVSNVSLKDLDESINKVASSLHVGKDQIFVQPMLDNVAISGVAFTRDLNTGGHYFVVNYDDHCSTTNSVTSGLFNNLKIKYFDKTSVKSVSDEFASLIALLIELESLFEYDSLDVEFALNNSKELYLLQVRQLSLTRSSEFTAADHRSILERICKKIEYLSKPHPYLHGAKAVFGIMPDWNPAEIIGTRPGTLALTLYKELITDRTWAYQRNNYGYRNLRSFPLLVTFAGLPYIDVRVSFNSFVPKDIKDALADKLVNYYIERLVSFPLCHDKVEFEIIFSCYTLDLPNKLKILLKHGFTTDECSEFAESLRKLTNNIINQDTGLWKKDILKIEQLEERREKIKNSSLDVISKIYWLIEDCKRYGTLPFAGLARAGFIAVQLLQSLVDVNVLSFEDYQAFMSSLETVSSKMANDLKTLSKHAFLEKYGHLRPGTYDIMSTRYDEEPDRYFDWSGIDRPVESDKTNGFTLSLAQLSKTEILLKEHRLEHNVLSLFNFIKSAIEGREYAKFVFTKSLSNVLQLFGEYTDDLGFNKQDASFADISIIKQLYESCDSCEEIVSKSIEVGKNKYAIASKIVLPPLIISADDVVHFEMPVNRPNFITLNKITGKVVAHSSDKRELKGNILFIHSADPGYDWIFSCGIGGFVTMYGGANSHMAIRAGELAIPAVIGAGKVLFEQWSKADILEIDCANQSVKILR